MAAMLTGQQFVDPRTGQNLIELDEAEAAMLGGALYDVAEHYGIVLSGPAAVWVKLAAAVGMVYAPRFIAISQLAAMQRAARRAQPTNGAAAPEAASFSMNQGPIQYPN